MAGCERLNRSECGDRAGSSLTRLRGLTNTRNRLVRHLHDLKKHPSRKDKIRCNDTSLRPLSGNLNYIREENKGIQEPTYGGSYYLTSDFLLSKNNIL